MEKARLLFLNPFQSMFTFENLFQMSSHDALLFVRTMIFEIKKNWISNSRESIRSRMFIIPLTVKLQMPRFESLRESLEIE